MIKILLVDDHVVVRTGIAKLLHNLIDIEVTGAASCGEDAVRLIEQQSVDIVLLDLLMPGISGLKTASQLLEVLPTVKIIVLSSLESGTFLGRLGNVGIQGYLIKTASVEEIVKAIRKVHQGGTYFVPLIVQQLAQIKQCKNGGSSPFYALSQRELKVALLLNQSVKLTAMGRELGVDPKTISTYRSRLLKKLGITSNLDLMILAIQHKITADSNEPLHP